MDTDPRAELARMFTLARGTLDQEAFGLVLKVTGSYICKIEHRQSLPSIPLLKRLSRRFGVDLVRAISLLKAAQVARLERRFVASTRSEAR